jgi:hypothetical protein
VRYCGHYSNASRGKRNAFRYPAVPVHHRSPIPKRNLSGENAFAYRTACRDSKDPPALAALKYSGGGSLNRYTSLGSS